MVEIYFLESDHTLIPSDLIKATRDFSGFEEIHRQYWVKHGGQDGLCTYRDAFEYLTDDLRDHGLPVRYSNYHSFESIKSRKMK